MPRARHREAPAGRGHGKQLDRAKVVEAALALARERGEAGLSMRGVAARLGVDVAALYWHVRNKDELLALVAVAAAEAVDLPAPGEGPWQERVFALCQTLRARLKAHPELGLQSGASPWTTPFNARAHGRIVTLLAESVLQQTEGLLAAQSLLHTVTALAQSEVQSRQSSPDGVRRYVREVTRELPPGAVGAWRELARLPVEESFDATFGFAIRALLEGVASLSSTPAEPRPGVRARPTR